MKKNFLLLFVIGAMFSCTKDEATAPQQTQTSKEITAFSFKNFDDAKTTIDGLNITVNLPAGTLGASVADDTTDIDRRTI